ncbi:MAG: ATP-binding protein [Pseudomonadota bacterium]
MRAVIPIAATALLVGVCVALVRRLGFVDDALFGVAWHAGVAFALTVRFRSFGAVGATAGYLAAELAMGQPLERSLVAAVALGAASILARAVMRPHVRRGAAATRTGEWFVFFYGAMVFSLVVAAVESAAAAAGGATLRDIARFAPATAMVQLLGVASVAAVIARLDEFAGLKRLDRATLGATCLTIVLVGIVGAILAIGEPFEGRSTIIVLLAVPISIWLALMPHSLSGTLISLFGYQSALWLVLQDVGGPSDPEYGLVSTAYLVLVVAFQLVHALNRDRLSAMAQIERQNDELERRVEERTASLTEMTMRAVAADKAKSEFLAKISHELRTPLNGIIGLSSVMLSGKLGEAERANVELINASGLNLLELISRILEFSEEKPPPDVAEFVAFDPVELLSEAAEDARARAGRADEVQLRLRLSDDLPGRLYGDAKGARGALAALLDNAFKFTARGSVTLAARLGDGDDPSAKIRRLRIEVIDTGRGVAPEDAERIFKPFEQADGSDTRTHGGAGLGLAAATGFVRRNGGEIGVESEPGAGAAFWFELDFEASEARRAAA